MKDIAKKDSNFGSLYHALVMLKQLQMCFVQANRGLWYRATVNSHNFVHLLRFLCPSDRNPCRFFCSAPNRMTSFPRTFLRACTNGAKGRTAVLLSSSCRQQQQLPSCEWLWLLTLCNCLPGDQHFMQRVH